MESDHEKPATISEESESAEEQSDFEAIVTKNGDPGLQELVAKVKKENSEMLDLVKGLSLAVSRSIIKYEMNKRK